MNDTYVVQSLYCRSERNMAVGKFFGLILYHPWPHPHPCPAVKTTFKLFLVKISTAQQGLCIFKTNVLKYKNFAFKKMEIKSPLSQSLNLVVNVLSAVFVQDKPSHFMLFFRSKPQACNVCVAITMSDPHDQRRFHNTALLKLKTLILSFRPLSVETCL